MTNHSTRRTFLGTTLVAAGGVSLLGLRGSASARSAFMQDEQPLVGEVASPSWVFVINTLQDPYAGEVIRPEEPEPGTRYVGAEVEIRNDSQEPLNFTPGSVRLLDDAGFEYVSGSVAGSEPLLPSLNMSPGDRIRGWVWYAVPEAAQLVEIVYVAPSPRLAVNLSNDA